MELLRIEGSRADLLGLRDVPDLHVVGPSAVDRGDGSWLVSVYAPDGGSEALRERGLTVHRLKPAAQVSEEWAAATAALDEEAVGAGYLPSDAIGRRLRELAESHPDVCAVDALPHRTHEDREVSLLRIGSGQAATVVVIGGVHAREWAPPDSLLSFAEGLVRASATGGSLDYPEWIDRSAARPITYASWSVPAGDVQRIVAGLTLLLVPLTNPDGRDFSLAETDELHRMWRKNRRPAAGGEAGPWCRGVDLNRNFDLAWDFERYYNASGAREVRSSKRPCDPEIFIGPAAASEPETLNVQSLVEQHRPSHFMDVHSYSRAILFPWGMDDDQGRDPTESVRNPDWDRDGRHGGRDGVGGVYGEFLPRDLAAAHQAIGRRMRDAIRDQAGSDPRARRRSMYEVKQALGLYPTTGTSDDWCVGLGMLDGSRPPMHGFCLECGIDQARDDPTDNEGGFHPDYRLKFPKIEREVHAAVLALALSALDG
jgi:murein tripeptide amidase MpaA